MHTIADEDSREDAAELSLELRDGSAKGSNGALSSFGEVTKLPPSPFSCASRNFCAKALCIEDFIMDEYYVVNGSPNLCRFTSFLVNGMERRNPGSSLHT
jgi:hypothetical protein